MTARDLLEYEIDDIGYQLDAVVHGMPETAQEVAPTPISMTPKQTIEHLCEAYQAVTVHAEGGTYEWGSFSIADKSWSNLTSTLESLRMSARSAVTQDENEDRLKSGYDYIVAHDAYHVGQLAIARIAADPEWDPYSMYRK